MYMALKPVVQSQIPHTRDNESGACFQKDHGETIELVQACDEGR